MPDEPLQNAAAATDANASAAAPVHSSSASDMTGAAAAPSRAAEPQSLGEFARDFHAKLAAEPGDVEAEGGDAVAGAAAQTGPDAAAADAGGDVLAEFGLAEGGWTPEQAGMLSEKLNEIRQSVESYHAWHQQAQQYVGQVEDLNQRLYAIVADPRIEQALQMLEQPGGVAPGAAAAGKPPAFESETEERLWNETQQLKQQLGQMRQMLDETHGGFQAFRAEADHSERRAKAQTYAQQIATTYETLEKEFPGLDRKACSQKAARLVRAQQAAGDEVDIASALREAAMILHYPNAQKAGASTALAAARKAARQAALPREAPGGDADLQPRDGEGLAEFARRAVPALAS